MRATRVLRACRMLMIDRKWGEKILDGEKLIEVRHFKNEKRCGERIGLCFNGTGRVFGYVTLKDNIKFCPTTWETERGRHLCMDETVPYGGRAWGWVCADPEWLEEPIRVQRRTGAQIFQKLEVGMLQSKRS